MLRHALCDTLALICRHMLRLRLFDAAFAFIAALSPLYCHAIRCYAFLRRYHAIAVYFAVIMLRVFRYATP